MSRRFKNLKAALTFLRSPTAAEGTPTPDAPAGTILKNFQDYASGKVVTTKNGSTQGTVDSMALSPFATAISDPKYRIGVSAKAFEDLAKYSVTAAMLGVAETTPETITARGFSPAKAVIMRFEGGIQEPTSKITGRKYKRRPGGARVFPFGQTDGNPLYSSQKTAITTAVDNSDILSVSFIPEKF